MSDRELQELAAKAAGINVIPMGGLTFMRRTGVGDYIAPWNPLTDDGDALRLAVKLNLAVSIEDGKSWAHHEAVYAGSAVTHDGKDPCAATRRAIVRAAAEIGRTM